MYSVHCYIVYYISPLLLLLQGGDPLPGLMLRLRHRRWRKAASNTRQ